MIPSMSDAQQVQLSCLSNLLQYEHTTNRVFIIIMLSFVKKKKKKDKSKTKRKWTEVSEQLLLGK